MGKLKKLPQDCTFPQLGIVFDTGRFAALLQSSPEFEAAAISVRRIRLERVLALTRELKIDPKFVDSSQLQVQPEYRWNEKDSQRVLLGYVVSRQIEIELRDLERLGTLLERSVSAGVNVLGGARLDSTRRKELEREALAKAVDDERFDQGSRSSRYHYYLLELRYLRRHYPPSTFPTAVEAMPGFVNVSPTRFFIHLDEAIDELCRRLLDRLSPALRLERPGLARAPVGRSETVITALAEFQAGRSVALTGQGGVGNGGRPLSCPSRPIHSQREPSLDGHADQDHARLQRGRERPAQPPLAHALSRYAGGNLQCQ